MSKKQPHKPSWLRRLLRKLIIAMLLLFVLSLLPVIALRWVDPISSSFMLQRQFQAYLDGDESLAVYYQWVDYDQISPELKLSAIASEDQKFPDHHGFDIQAIRQVLSASGTGGPSRGASTISQQLAKNLFLWPGRSWVRKGLEAYFTASLEIFLPKERILALYLNLAEFGDGVYGAEAAAKTYFGVPAIGLNRRQSALLAAKLPSPKRYKIHPPDPHVERRAQWIEKQIKQLGEYRLLQQLVASD